MIGQNCAPADCGQEQKDVILPKYWKIPPRQIETSVVLASPEWLQLNNHASTELATGS